MPATWHRTRTPRRAIGSPFVESEIDRSSIACIQASCLKFNVFFVVVVLGMGQSEAFSDDIAQPRQVLTRGREPPRVEVQLDPLGDMDARPKLCRNQRPGALATMLLRRAAFDLFAREYLAKLIERMAGRLQLIDP